MSRKILATFVLMIVLPFGGAGLGCSAPAVPHQVESSDRAYCLSCHEEGIKGAPKTSHPGKDSCVSCHDVPRPTAPAPVGSTSAR